MPLPPTDAHGWPFASGAGQVVTEHDWETMARTWQVSGVVGQPGDSVGLVATRVNETQILIQPGVATINGHYYELKLAHTFDIDITGSGWGPDDIRHDLVTLRLDRASDDFQFVQIKGGVDLTGGQLALETSEEIPVLQVDVTNGVGIATEPVDRRWFIGRHVRPISGAVPGMDPAPFDGELGVDTTNNYLVVGSEGAWVPASQVFANDGGSGGAIAALDVRVTTLEGQTSTLQTNLTSTQTTVTGLAAGSWTNITNFANSFASASGATLAVRKQGVMVNLRGTMQKANGSDFASSLAGTGIFCFTLPAGFFPGQSTVFPIIGRTGAGALFQARMTIASSGSMTLESGSNTIGAVTAVSLSASWMTA
ncbi:hypothetical protein [Acrocarpospora sp. B8E8]|uniref:hypothetical protein n=1 Tax=Acrocarpospora sp. B8E8 TaxID=3153572 RepID=UPI00325F9C3A